MTLQEKLDKFHKRDFSWSSMSSFAWDKDDWYNKYILDQRPTSPELQFGSAIDKKIQKDPSFLPNLPRYEEMQYKMRVVFAGITLVGIPDGLNLKNKKELADYKTGRNAWTLQKAKETGQLKFYLLLIYITLKIKPEEFDCYIHWLETKKEETGDFKTFISFVEEANIQTFKVKHTLIDIINFGVEIKKTYKAMEDFIKEKEGIELA